MAKHLKERIESLFADVRKRFPVDDGKLYDGGKIYYMNGNDSTRFDWQVNGKVCEFMIFWKASEVGYIKLDITAYGTANVFVYKDFAMTPYHTEKDEEFMHPDDVKELAAVMMEIADEKEIWDEDIDKLDWNVDSRKCLEEHSYDLEPDEDEW